MAITWLAGLAILFDSASAQPFTTLTLEKFADPPTYSAPGTVITYTYRLTNDGPGTLETFADLFIEDDPLGFICDVPLPFAPGETETCEATYTTNENDVAEGRTIENSAIALGNTCGECASVSSNTAFAAVGFAAPTGSLTVVKTTTGGDGTFDFTSTVPGFASFNLTTVSGTASRAFGVLSTGTYTITEGALPPDWSLASLICTGDTGGTPTITDVGTQTATIGLDSGESIVCTFANTLATDQTSPVIQSFLSHRAARLADGPDRTRIFRRIPDALWGNTGGNTGAGGSSGPFAFSGRGGEDGSMQMSIETSLVQLSNSYAQARGQTQLPMPEIDVWVEAHYAEFEDDAPARHTDGSFGILYAGVDYLVTPAVIVGALAQFDWTEEDASDGSSAEGFGIMGGPYVSARLAPHLFFSARAAFGGSDNSINPIGRYTDDFDTDRWLVSAEITGNWNFGNWRVTPSAGVTYVEENQDDYVDSLGVPIPEQTVSLGQFEFGPEIAYRFVAESGVLFEPQVSLTGLWDFDGPDGGAVSALISTDDDVRAMLKAGLLTRFTGGASFRIVGTYDGIGSDGYESFGGQAWLNIPLR